MKDKVITTIQNKDDGYSYILIQNKYGHFCGISNCHMDDLPNFSEFTGYRYAEIRANMMFAKRRLQQEKIKLHTIENLLKDINYCDRSRDEICPEVMRKIRLKLRDYTQSVEDWENLYCHLKTAVYEEDKKRQEIINRTKEANNKE